MNTLNTYSNTIIAQLKSNFPDKVQFRRKQIDDAASSLSLEWKQYREILDNKYRVHKGLYDYSSIISPDNKNSEPSARIMKLSAPVTSVINTDTYIPVKDFTYQKWGNYSDILNIIKSKSFYPCYISGLSGNGKTMMVEQVCADLEREYIRVQISPETDEDDLIGGFRLLNGETVFAKGPVVKAMERGAILLIDEIDRSTSKIMCLQGVLEGKPIMIKKTGEVIHPSLGFNVFATANTKGRGSEDGKFVTANIIDEAFLERFVATFEQSYPTSSVEKKIIINHMEKYGNSDFDFAEKLATWSEVIRKTYEAEGVDELVSTRRLCHITHTFSIFQDRLKSIQLCISRFDEDTKIAFLDLYTKIDASVGNKPKDNIVASGTNVTEDPTLNNQ